MIYDQSLLLCYTQIYNEASHDNDRSAGLAAVLSNCYASDNAATPGRVLPKNSDINWTYCKYCSLSYFNACAI